MPSMTVMRSRLSLGSMLRGALLLSACTPIVAYSPSDRLAVICLGFEGRELAEDGWPVCNAPKGLASAFVSPCFSTSLACLCLSLHILSIQVAFYAILLASIPLPISYSLPFCLPCCFIPIFLVRAMPQWHSLPAYCHTQLLSL